MTERDEQRLRNDEFDEEACAAGGEYTYERLVVALSNGSTESVLAHLAHAEMDDGQRATLITQAVDRKRTWSTAGQFERMAMAGLACHTDAEAAVRWLFVEDSGVIFQKRLVDPRKMATLLVDAIQQCWPLARVRHFAQVAPKHAQADLLYPLMLELCRRTGVIVEPTGRLVTGCMDYYLKGVEKFDTRRADPREDPLLPSVMEHLDLTAISFAYSLARSYRKGSPDFIRFLVEHQIADRELLLRKAMDGLRVASENDTWWMAMSSDTVLDGLQLTAEESDPLHEYVVRLAGTVPSHCLHADRVASAVRALADQGRLPTRAVNRLIRNILDSDDQAPNPAINCAAAIAQLSGSGLVTDKRLAGLVAFVTSDRLVRPLHVMRALLPYADRRLTPDQVIACARVALDWPEEDVSSGLIEALWQVVSREPGRAGTVLPLLAGAFWSDSLVLQDQALCLALEYRDHIDDHARESLREAAEQLEPALLVRAAELFGPIHAERARPSASPSPLREHAPISSTRADEGVKAAGVMKVPDEVFDGLPEETKAFWRPLLRPAAILEWLDPEDGGEGPAVGYEGGLPRLPKEVSWPMWRNVPLAHVATLDCARLPRDELDIPLPEQGTLVFFSYVWARDPESIADDFFPGHNKFGPGEGTKVLYIPASEKTRIRPAPENHVTFQHKSLRLKLVSPTMPSREHHLLPLHYETAGYEELEDSLEAHYGFDWDIPWPQVGGYADHPQGAVEAEASALLAPDEEKEQRRKRERDFVMLFSHDEPEGQRGVYWMIRREDLAAQHFDNVIPIAQG